MAELRQQSEVFFLDAHTQHERVENAEENDGEIEMESERNNCYFQYDDTIVRVLQIFIWSRGNKLGTRNPVDLCCPKMTQREYHPCFADKQGNIREKHRWDIRFRMLNRVLDHQRTDEGRVKCNNNGIVPFTILNPSMLYQPLLISFCNGQFSESQQNEKYYKRGEHRVNASISAEEPSRWRIPVPSTS